MKRFIAITMLFALIQGVLAVGLIAYYRQDRHPNDYMAAARDKAALLDRTPSPRVMFIGGSNVALGIESAAVSRALSLQPVNMGLISGVGFEMMASQIEPHLRAGDVVVVSLEYERWVHRFHELSVWDLLEHQPEAWRDIPAGYVPQLLDTSLVYLGRMASTVRLKFAGRPPSAPSAPYLREGFNEFGDQTLHWDTMMEADEPLGRAEIHALAELSEAGVRNRIARVNEFGDRARAKGALVLLTFPAVTPDVYADWSAELTWLYELLDKELTVPLLDRPEELVYPREQFTDHIYHLNLPGTERRMRHLVPRVRAELAAAGHPAAGSE